MAKSNLLISTNAFPDFGPLIDLDPFTWHYFEDEHLTRLLRILEHHGNMVEFTLRIVSDSPAVQADCLKQDDVEGVSSFDELLLRDDEFFPEFCSRSWKSILESLGLVDVFLDDFDPTCAFLLGLGLELEFSVVCLYHNYELASIFGNEVSFLD